MAKLENAVKNSGNFAFTMRYKPNFPVTFFGGKNPFAGGGTALLSDIIHPDDYQPFCDVIGDIINKKRGEIKAHARLKTDSLPKGAVTPEDGAYRWYYISAAPEFQRNGSLKEISGMMFDVTEYLDCEGDDAVMLRFKSKSETSMENAGNTPRLLEILGKDYLERIQQPFSQITGLYSTILDENGKIIAAAFNQDKDVNLNKMSYQRKKSIRVKHQNVGSWVIAGESQDNVNNSAALLDTMVQTVSEIANSYVVIGEEMENSQKANKLLGQNFEDQILINNIYSMILSAHDTAASFGSVVPLVKEYFGLDDILYYARSANPIKLYHWDDVGGIYPTTPDGNPNETVEHELDYDAVVCIGEDELMGRNTNNRSCALSRVYDNGEPRGDLVYIARDSDREWSNRDKKIIKTVTQIMSRLIFRQFMENELEKSRERLLRLAYYNPTTGIPNRSAFERDFRQKAEAGKKGAVIAVEISNLKNLSEIYTAQYANEIVKSIAEYISAIPASNQKQVYHFSADIIFVTINGVTRAEAQQFAKTILTKFRTPWFLNDNETQLEIYAGVCLVPENADELSDCIRIATRTLRLAKEKNLHDALCYSDGLEEELVDNRHVRKLIMESAENGFNGFYFLYTPVVNADTGALVCCEAHLFWGNGETIVPRDRFIPIIERMGILAELYAFVMDRICEFCAAVRESGIHSFRVSYPISEHMLSLDESVLILRKALLEYSLPPDAISVTLSDGDNTLSSTVSVKQLAATGVNIIADDKGGKFFTASALDNPYVKLIKLRSRRLSDEPVAAGFVKTLIERAHEKGVAVCVKGVDNASALETARSFGADMIQGIINGRPLHTSEFIKKMVVNHPLSVDG